MNLNDFVMAFSAGHTSDKYKLIVYDEETRRKMIDSNFYMQSSSFGSGYRKKLIIDWFDIIDSTIHVVVHKAQAES